MSSTETIVAVATPPGRGGIGIVRISGPRTTQIAEAVLGALPPPRSARVTRFRDERGEPLDVGIALYFPGPRSFTGEDVLEFHGHGGPVVLDMLLRRVIALGARMARPGEFSERAFLNDKIDLTQAEAVADLIDSSSETAARSALRSLSGEFSRRIRSLASDVTDLRVYIEAAIDFPEDEIDFLADRSIAGRLYRLIDDLQELLSGARQGQLLRDGLHVVIIGRPNAGKSSLLNALTGSDRAIVSVTPGTTRDTIEHSIQIDGLPVHLTDTAGLRATSDEIEGEGVKRARTAIANADHALVIVDDSLPDDGADLLAEVPAALSATLVFNKIDLSGRSAGRVVEDDDALAISAKTGTGLDELRGRLRERAGYQDAGESTFIARRRHLDALMRADRGLQSARARLEQDRAGELMAEELRLVQSALGEIIGDVSSDELLGRIFATFCIGK